MCAVGGAHPSSACFCVCSYREASEEDLWCSDGAMCEEEEDNLAVPSVEDDNRPVIEKVIRGGVGRGGVGWGGAA